jgi:hypothetical protein
MGSTLKNFFKEIFKKGLMITWSDGPMFDPSTQERTDGLQDLVKQKTREEDMARKGDCGGTPRVGKKGDPKPRRGKGRRRGR